jgi:hypothetical protein
MHEETMLTLGDLIELSGYTRRQLQDWARKGLLPSAEPSSGTGFQRRWSMSEGLGLLVATRLHSEPRSCALVYVGAIVAAFGRYPLRHWQKRLAMSPGFMGILESGSAAPYHLNVMLGELLPDRLDASACLRDLLTRVEAMQARLARTVAPGRRRGLAGKATNRI